MVYKDPDYMTKWRAANKEQTARYNRRDYRERKQDATFRAKKRKQANETYHRDPTVRRASVLLKQYGITPTQYAEMLAAQHGGCAICHTSVPGVRTRYFAVDHDHVTGELRGLLCTRCNMALGLFQDSSPILDQASAYLKKYCPS
jgi:Recombination endonuclease VII